jgi:phenol 2-monooxygenase
MGAFGLNASIMDACNLAWKIGLCARNQARLSVLGPTYCAERRLHANCIIRVSGSYLRFICHSDLPLAEFDAPPPSLSWVPDAVPYTAGEELDFLRAFFANNGPFLLGVDAPYAPGVLVPEKPPGAIGPLNGVRAPNPRLCFSASETGYLYDMTTGAATFHLLLFVSDLRGPVRRALARFAAALGQPQSFYSRFGGPERFNLVVVAKAVPFEAEDLMAGEDLSAVRRHARLLFDDRAPDEDAHTCYEVDHAEGAVVVVRPDLWIGTSAFLGDGATALDEYFGNFML